MDEREIRLQDALHLGLQVMQNAARYSSYEEWVAAGRDAVNSLCMEVGQCGEAVAKLGAEETAKHPLIFGKLMSSTRNNLFHDYPDMKYLQAWEVASSTVPRMVEYLSSILPDLPGYDPYRIDRGGYAT